MPLAHRQRLRRLDKAACALGVFFNIHVIPLSLPASPVGAISKNGHRFCVRSRRQFRIGA
jgi:hypothetical protein